jgi:hypothetical protein
MEVLLKRSTRVVLAMALAAMMMLLLASEAMAKHGGLHMSQPSRPPGNPDSGINTGRGNQVTHGNPGGPTDTGPSQAVVSPSLIQQA